MEINLNTLLFIVSLIFMLAYQYSIFLYSSKLLLKGSRRKSVYISLALINTAIFVLCQLLNVQYYLFIVLFYVALSIEFKLISRSNYIHLLCGSSIFVLHISALITPIVAIFSNVTGMAPIDLLDGTIYDNIIVIIACLFLMLAQEVVKKYIDNKSIQRICTQGKYSVMLLVSVLSVVLFQTAHAMLIINDKLYFDQIYLTSVISFGSLIVFYLFLVYAIGLINANLYKRYSDKVIVEHDKINVKKEVLIRKTERDELTNVYNRRYVLAALDKLCESPDEGSFFFVLFIDINGLKYTNDKFGHSAGDRLITKIASAIEAAVREDDIVARIGGDEFLVLVTTPQDQDCSAITDRIEQMVAVQDKTEEFLVSASIGSILADYNMQKLGASYILSKSDENMRINKERFYKQQKEG